MSSNENQQSTQPQQPQATSNTATGALSANATAQSNPATTTSTTSSQAQAQNQGQSVKSNANIIAALSSAFKSSTGESLHHDKIAQLLIAHMDQISELAKQGKLSQAQIEQPRQFANGNVPASGATTATQQQTQAKPSLPQFTQPASTTSTIAPGTSAFKATSPAPTGTTLTSDVMNTFPISHTLSVTNPGPQPFPAATGRPTLSGGFASGRVSGTPAQIARTDDSSVLSSDTSNRRKNTPNDQSMRRSIQ